MSQRGGFGNRLNGVNGGRGNFLAGRGAPSSSSGSLEPTVAIPDLRGAPPTIPTPSSTTIPIHVTQYSIARPHRQEEDEETENAAMELEMDQELADFEMVVQDDEHTASGDMAGKT